MCSFQRTVFTILACEHHVKCNQISIVISCKKKECERQVGEQNKSNSTKFDSSLLGCYIYCYIYLIVFTYKQLLCVPFCDLTAIHLTSIVLFFLNNMDTNIFHCSVHGLHSIITITLHLERKIKSDKNNHPV